MRMLNLSFGHGSHTTKINPVANYLRVLSHELTGLVSIEEREFFLQEQEHWLDKRVRNFVLQGLNYEEACEKAVRSHDKPKTLALQLAMDYFEDQVDAPIYNHIGRANSIASIIFGQANLFYLLFLQMKIYLPSSEPLSIRMSPAQLREIFPAPLPFPDMSWQFFITVGFPLIAPWLLGWLCGRLVPVGASAAVTRVMLVVVISAFLLGSALLPQTDGILYALFLTFYWLPVGATVAHLSSYFRRGQLRRKMEAMDAHPSSSPTIKEVSP